MKETKQLQTKDVTAGGGENQSPHTLKILSISVFWRGWWRWGRAKCVFVSIWNKRPDIAVKVSCPSFGNATRRDDGREAGFNHLLFASLQKRHLLPAIVCWSSELHSGVNRRWAELEVVHCSNLWYFVEDGDKKRVPLLPSDTGARNELCNIWSSTLINYISKLLHREAIWATVFAFQQTETPINKTSVAGNHEIKCNLCVETFQTTPG